MKKLFLMATALVLIGVYHANGQISIVLSTDRDRYIQFEPVKVTITLKNYSGQTLDFGNTGKGDTGYLKFQITDVVGKLVTQIKPNLELAKDLALFPGATKSISFTLSEFFDIQKEEDYELVARVGHNRFKDDFLSKSVHFQVRSGIRVWNRVVGLPDPQKSETITTRICSLNTIHYDDGDIYFLQIEDDDFVYTTLRLGPRVLGINPLCEVDALSRVHTLIQTAPRLLNYRIFDLQGDLKQNNYYLAEKTVPTLYRDSELGTVTVMGGKKAVEGVDFNLSGKEKSTLDPITGDMPRDK